MLDIYYENSFKADYKKLVKQGFDIDVLSTAIEYLINKIELPKKYKNHSLTGSFKGYFDCHLKPDCVLIYKIENNTLYLVRIGSHSNLFKSYK
ncbi:toxin-antitoxin system, toxin component, YafQ family [Campylobacter hyointestinalis subsp. lawsonii CCUG 27631]|uniref:type II toxin-antitoxin system YafQ family toxin n=1 Tax=Campylobacter hyointestinalis TaxID=198 RepID=UPI0007C95586|nr:type II toxin-antitoxin system mRNA interferase toxin, RelE/StbE family [Campylobacter hyointestinalis]ANE34686.1 toxin-antitoxin system, toxin component, YafQ family [Campylobacter hyointestinalis subsp. lawsonii CCUG 27631]